VATLDGKLVLPEGPGLGVTLREGPAAGAPGRPAAR
jgi:hypothetical protein